MKQTLLAMGLLTVVALPAGAAVISTTTHGAGNTDLNGLMGAGDLIAGLIATELPGDNGWHPANPASANPLHPDGLPAFTDGIGDISGVTGLLNDFPGAGNPTKLIEYDLGGAKDITRIHVFTGNAGLDGRVFSTTVVKYSNDGGNNFNMLGYFQSDPSGTVNSGQLGSTLVEIFDDAQAVMLPGVTHLEFDFYSVDNTLGEMRDPFDDVNPFTGMDDALTAAFVSPLVYEIDVLPEPASLGLLALGGLVVLRRRR